MWPFKRKESLQERLQREALEAEDLYAEKWLIFRQLEFGDDVPLGEQILLLMEPAIEGVLKAKPLLAAGDSNLLSLVLINGIAKTGTHAALEVQDALGIPRG